MLDRENIRWPLVDLGLTRVANDIALLAQPCIQIYTTPGSDSEIPVGASKFGGVPDTAANFSWPEWHKHPLAFLGQINLAELAADPIEAPLPLVNTTD